MAESESGHGTGDAKGYSRLFWPPPEPAEPINPLRRPVSWLAVGMIKCYQRTLSRLWPNVCMYHPSCSHYAVHAITKRGVIVGMALGTWRILRCHPFARGGYDPPPGYEEALARSSNKEASRDAGA